MPDTRFSSSPGGTAPLPAVGNSAPPPLPPPAGNRPPAVAKTGRQGWGWGWKGAGLVVVAVLAGLLWWVIRHDSAPAQGIAEPDPAAVDHAGGFDFNRVAGPVRSNDCAGNSYGQVKNWFTTQPCQALSRALYSTKSGENRVLVSVIVVTMSSPEQAQQLKSTTDTENTGNLSDLVRDGSANVPGAPKVAEGEYASQVTDRTLTIVEANFFEQYNDKETLTRISTDGLGLAEQVR